MGPVKRVSFTTKNVSFTTPCVNIHICVQNGEFCIYVPFCTQSGNDWKVLENMTLNGSVNGSKTGLKSEENHCFTTLKLSVNHSD